jgi:hypothetical protein
VAICDACLQKNADHRPTAKQLAERLEATWQPDAQAREYKPDAPARETLPLARASGCHGRRTRWLLVGGVAAALLVLGLGLWAFNGTRKPEPVTEPPQNARLTAKLEVIHFDRVENARDGKKDVEVGTIGMDSMNALYADRVAIEARLSEPGYAYLIAFNFDGKEQLLWPCDARHPDRVPLPDRAPDRVAHFRYPPPAPEGVTGEAVKPKLFRLDDVKTGGIQAFLAVVSREPLPPYAKWREARKAPPWKHLEPERGVWRSNGETLDPMRKGGLRDRGSVVTREGQPPLLELCRWARAEGALVEGVAFPVNPRE